MKDQAKQLINCPQIYSFEVEFIPMFLTVFFQFSNSETVIVLLCCHKDDKTSLDLIPNQNLRCWFWPHYLGELWTHDLIEALTSQHFILNKIKFQYVIFILLFFYLIWGSKMDNVLIFVKCSLKVWQGKNCTSVLDQSYIGHSSPI